MGMWDKLFGKGKGNSEDKGEPQNTSANQENAASSEKEENASEYNLQWIQANQNPWNVEILDLRPISQTMLSTSKDPAMATNAISYNQEDGLVFLSQLPKSPKSVASHLTFPIDSRLENGVLFIPNTMEHKWAIYFHQNKLLFIRSWLREVFVIAETKQENNNLIVHQIRGEFTENESSAFTESVLKFLIHSHVLNEMVPAPIPNALKNDTDQAGLWSFSTYGNMAHFGHFEDSISYTTNAKLRSHSLLHIAVARGEFDKIKKELENGANINALAGDGLSTLQWSLGNDISILEFLLNNGADPNVQSAEGATPLMNAVQSNRMEHLQALIHHNADVNKQDFRGFTALHRAAEMGHLEMVEALLQAGANKEIEAEGHTALSLAKAMNHGSIVELL